MMRFSFGPLLGGLCLLGLGCAPGAGLEDPLRLSLQDDDFTLRVQVLNPQGENQPVEEVGPSAYRLLVIPAGTQSIELRLENGPSQSPSLLTAPRVVNFASTGPVGPKSFTKLRPGQYKLTARAYSLTGATGGLLGERVLVQSYNGGGSTTVTLRLRVTPLDGRVAF